MLFEILISDKQAGERIAWIIASHFDAERALFILQSPSVCTVTARSSQRHCRNCSSFQNLYWLQPPCCAPASFGLFNQTQLFPYYNRWTVITVFKKHCLNEAQWLSDTKCCCLVETAWPVEGTYGTALERPAREGVPKCQLQFEVFTHVTVYSSSMKMKAAFPSERSVSFSYIISVTSQNTTSTFTAISTSNSSVYERSISLYLSR